MTQGASGFHNLAAGQKRPAPAPWGARRCEGCQSAALERVSYVYPKPCASFLPRKQHPERVLLVLRFHYAARERENWIIILKGGPGVGKSTLIKRLGKEAEELGYSVEYHHCSADPDSLDVIAIPDLGVAMLDGTHPHVIDPKYPGAVDEIVHLGEYWDDAGIRRHRTEIALLSARSSQAYQRAYRYLAAARLVYDEIEAIHSRVANFGRLNQIAEELIERLLPSTKAAPTPGSIRRLFGSAITPRGAINHLDILVGAAKPTGRRTGGSRHRPLDDLGESGPGRKRTRLCGRVFSLSVRSGESRTPFHPRARSFHDHFRPAAHLERERRHGQRHTLSALVGRRSCSGPSGKLKRRRMNTSTSSTWRSLHSNKPGPATTSSNGFTLPTWISPGSRASNIQACSTTSFAHRVVVSLLILWWVHRIRRRWGMIRCSRTGLVRNGMLFGICIVFDWSICSVGDSPVRPISWPLTYPTFQ